MMKSRLPCLAVLACLCLTPLTSLAQPVVSYVKPGARFEDVRDDLKLAIESRGLVIDHQSRIHEMLERTGKDLGTLRSLYVGAQAMQFCSANLSRKMMEADPANVVMCPFTVVVYATAAKPADVVVSYRVPMRPGSPPSTAALNEVAQLLDGIAREATQR